MKYYIFQNNNFHEVKVELEPRLSKAFDTTNDSLSCVLKANSVSEPYAPMTVFQTKDDSNNYKNYWIINDTVDVFSLKPLRYKHTLSIVQLRYFLNKHLIRNTVFNQPRKNKLELYGAMSSTCDVDVGHDESDPDILTWMHLVTNNTTKRPNFWGEKLPLNYHTKIKTLSYHIKLFAGTMAGSYPGYTPSQWLELSGLDSTYNVKFNDDAYIALVDVNNSNYQLLKINYNNNIINKDIVLSDADIDTINSYISHYQNAVLRVMFRADNVGSSPYTSSAFSFVLPIQNQVPHYDGQGNINPEIYTKERYRYMTVQITFNLEIYNYTMYDVLETLIKQTSLVNLTQGSKHNDLFKLPSGAAGTPADSRALYQLLKTTYPADTMSFTQCTMYDALVEIFRYYDAGFYFDENRIIHIEYYNNPLNQIEPTLVGKQISHSDKNYNNGRVAYYQNAILPVKIPRMTIRSQSLGKPSQSDFGILLEKSIYNIGKLYVDVWDDAYQPPLNAYSYGYNIQRMKLDITPFVVNDQEYSVLSKADETGFSSGDDLTLKYQVSTLHFARGGNFINASETNTTGQGLSRYNIYYVLSLAAARYFGYGTQLSTATPQKLANPVENTWTQYVFSIEYLTMNNGRSIVETTTYKYDGTQIVNQDTGLIDLNKLGLNILGESLKDGEPVLTASCVITNWSNRIKEGDYWVDDNGDYWVANIVNYNEIAPNKYRCNVEFSKNFNALALRVQSDKQKRLTNVSSENTVLSEDNFIDYVYAGIHGVNEISSSEEIILNENVLASLLCQTFKDGGINNIENIDIKFSLINTMDIDYEYNIYGDDETETRNIYIPVLKYGAGNCVCFEMQYKDALSAGNKLSVSSGWFGTDEYFSTAALYTDDEGWADAFDIRFCDLTTNGEISDIGTFPIVDANVIANDNTKLVRVVSKIEGLKYYKKPNEIFGLNYEWCFLVEEKSKNDLFIGNKFIIDNFYTNREAIASKKFYLRYIPSSDTTNNEKYSVLDTKGIGNNVEPITGIRINSSNLANHKVTFGFNTATTISAKRWAIVDENNDIYFACNTTKSFTNLSNSYQLYFITKKQRIKDF